MIYLSAFFFSFPFLPRLLPHTHTHSLSLFLFLTTNLLGGGFLFHRTFATRGKITVFSAMIYSVRFFFFFLGSNVAFLCRDPCEIWGREQARAIATASCRFWAEIICRRGKRERKREAKKKKRLFFYLESSKRIEFFFGMMMMMTMLLFVFFQKGGFFFWTYAFLPL